MQKYPAYSCSYMTFWQRGHCMKYSIPMPYRSTTHDILHDMQDIRYVTAQMNLLETKILHIVQPIMPGSIISALLAACCAIDVLGSAISVGRDPANCLTGDPYIAVRIQLPMRSIASVRFDTDEAYEQRMKPSPPRPNTDPGTAATFASSSSR